MEKLIFLDIDGVLNSTSSAVAFGGYPQGFKPGDLKKFSNVSVALVRKLVKESGAKVILSSTWRNTFTPKDVTFGLKIPIFDSTPILDVVKMSDYHIRGREVVLYFTSHPEFKDARYVIIDDNNEFLPHQLEWFVQTNCHTGFDYFDYKKARALLKDGKYEEKANEGFGLFVL